MTRGALLEVVQPNEHQLHLSHFDLLRATRGWACVRIGPAGRAVQPAGPQSRVHVNAGEVLHTASVGAETPWAESFRGTFLASLLLRPSVALRHAVATFEAEHQLTPLAYDAVHLRNLDGRCAAFFHQQRFLRHCQDVELPGRAVALDDMCNMSDSYIDAALNRARTWHPARQAANDSHDSDGPPPLLLTSDGSPHTTARARSLIARLGHSRRVVWSPDDVMDQVAMREAAAQAHQRRHRDKILAKQQKPHPPASPPPPPPPPLAPGGVVPRHYVDLLLLARSRLFVGNPASTFAQNVARMRAAELGEPFSNLRRCPRYP